MQGALRFDGMIAEVIVNREADRWFAFFTVDLGEPKLLKRPSPTVGINMDVGTLAAQSDGTTTENPRAL